MPTPPVSPRRPARAASAGRLAYIEAGPWGRAQALAYAQQALAAHFPTLSAATFRLALQELQPELWVTAAGEVELDYADLTHLVQYLSYQDPRAALDPPVYGHEAYYLAQQLVYRAGEAEQALAELYALGLPFGPGTSGLWSLVSRLAVGNAVAEQVLAAHSWLPGQGPPPPTAAEVYQQVIVPLAGLYGLPVPAPECLAPYFPLTA